MGLARVSGVPYVPVAADPALALGALMGVLLGVASGGPQGELSGIIVSVLIFSLTPAKRVL